MAALDEQILKLKMDAALAGQQAALAAAAAAKNEQDAAGFIFKAAEEKAKADKLRDEMTTKELDAQNKIAELIPMT